MSAKLWTPGPWTFYAPASWTDGLGYIRPLAEDGREIAHHGDADRTNAENLANARLIQHAPEMAELLEQVAALMDAFAAEAQGDLDDGASARLWNATRDKIDNIMARIRGETP